MKFAINHLKVLKENFCWLPLFLNRVVYTGCLKKLRFQFQRNVFVYNRAKMVCMCAFENSIENGGSDWKWIDDNKTNSEFSDKYN